MDRMDRYEEPQHLLDEAGEGSSGSQTFRGFVCVSLSALVLLHVYAYFGDHPLTESIEGDFSDVKFAVMQLTRGLTEVNRKHERLQEELERLTSSLPAVAAAASRARDAFLTDGDHDHATTGTHMAAVNAHDFDRQVIDFALESAGARVVDTGGTVDHVAVESPVGWVLHLLTTWMCKECLGARAVLRPGTLPGECWAFKGSRGEVTIRLLGCVNVNGMSIEHIPAQISPTREILSAPRKIQLFGLEHKLDSKPHDFGVFEYDKKGKSIQYFEAKNFGKQCYNLVKLKILSNWGHPAYTCVYRVRVHGELNQPPSVKHRDDAAGDTLVEIE